MSYITMPCSLKTCSLLTITCFLCLPLVISGCVSDSSTPRQTSTHPDDTAPAHPPAPEIDSIANSLMTFLARHGHLPQALNDLPDADALAAELDHELADYAYNPAGLGFLRDGRRIIFVDTIIRPPNHTWCIVETPDTTGIEMVYVPMSELREAAEAATPADQN